MKTLIAFCLGLSLAVVPAAEPSARTVSGITPGRAYVAASEAPTASAAPAASPADAQRAAAVLDGLREKYRYLEDVSVSIGATPNNEQAVAYYTANQIVLSPTHKASVEKILAHEVWHIIDWRDNGRLDWGEDLPPNNSSGYLKAR